MFKNGSFFTKKDVLTAVLGVAALIVPKFIFPDEYVEVVEFDDEPVDYTAPSKDDKQPTDTKPNA